MAHHLNSDHSLMGQETRAKSIWSEIILKLNVHPH